MRGGGASKRCSSEDLQTMPSMVEYAKGVNIYFSEGRCAYLSRHGAGVNYATVKDAQAQAQTKPNVNVVECIEVEGMGHIAINQTAVFRAEGKKEAAFLESRHPPPSV
eukprot:scaffold11832_cov155-Skeletonema_marinoi.AAC.5